MASYEELKARVAMLKRADKEESKSRKAREAKDAVGEGGEGALAALGFLGGNGGGGRPDEDEPPAVVLGVVLAGPLLGGVRVEVGPEGIAAARVGRTRGGRARLHGERDE